MLGGPHGVQHRRGPALDRRTGFPSPPPTIAMVGFALSLLGLERTVKFPELMSVSYRPTSDAAGHGNFEAVLVKVNNWDPGSATILATTSGRGFVDHASPANAFNVPLDGVSWNGNMYVLQHRSPPSGNIRLNGQIDTGPVGQQWPRLQTLYEVSRFEFINVSTVIIDAHEHGVPGAGPQLAVFGSGATAPAMSTLW